MFFGVENCPRRNLDKSLKQTLLNSYILNILAERVLLWIHFFFLIHRESFYIYSFGGRFYPKCLARWRSVQSILLVAQSRDKGLAFILNNCKVPKCFPHQRATRSLGLIGLLLHLIYICQRMKRELAPFHTLALSVREHLYGPLETESAFIALQVWWGFLCHFLSLVPLEKAN